MIPVVDDFARNSVVVTHERRWEPGVLHGGAIWVADTTRRSVDFCENGDSL